MHNREVVERALRELESRAEVLESAIEVARNERSRPVDDMLAEYEKLEADAASLVKLLEVN